MTISTRSNISGISSAAPTVGHAASQRPRRWVRLGAAVTPLVALLLAACGSAPTVESPEAKQEVAQMNSGWQAERAKYMDCVQDKASDGAKGKGTSKDVAAGAIDACKDQLKVMHDAFQSYLSAQMSSAHGQNSARQAADRVTTDTREKARTYLTRYVEVERYKAGQR
ncbi:hypothetical protein [Cupriavidus pauculus]|uniref:hypothetical protein n=1 Tax=Cupriavidus pauculus TaxID=82633 RepID=UPI0020A2DBA6|nr:hypothetical protein [Cupriavidus pauculus]